MQPDKDSRFPDSHCHDCGQDFFSINEEAHEFRCINCQTEWRKSEADKMHAFGYRKDYRAGCKVPIAPQGK